MSLGIALVLSVLAGTAYLTRRIGGDVQVDRPIVLGTIVGLILGDLETGVVVGGTLELVFIGAAAIGGSVPPNIVLAAVIGTAFAIEAGEGVETALLVAIPAGVVATVFELLAKTGCSFLVHRADLAAEQSDDRQIFRIIWAGNGIHFLAYAAPTFLALYFGRSTVESITDAITGDVNDGLAVAAALLPAVGFAILLSILSTRRLFPLFVIGFALAAYTDLTVIGVAILAVSLVVLLQTRALGTGPAASAAVPDAEARPVMAGGAVAAPALSPGIVRRLFWRSFLLQSAFNFERFQNLGFWWTLRTALNRLYPDREERREAYKRHLTFFNTHPWMVGPVVGVVASMEARRAAGERGIDSNGINSVKVSMMGPLAGLGDSLIFGAIRPVLSGVCAALAVDGNVLGPIIFLVAINAVHLPVRWYGVSWGYRYGERFFERLDPQQIERFKTAATAVGLTVVGALVATLISINTPLTYRKGESTVSVQDALDQVLPMAIPLAAALGAFWLLRRRLSPVWVLVIVAVVGIVGGYFGVLGVPSD